MESIEEYLAELRKGRCTDTMRCDECPIERIAIEKDVWLHCATSSDRIKSAAQIPALLAMEAFNA